MRAGQARIDDRLLTARLQRQCAVSEAACTCLGTRLEPLPWTPTMARLRDELTTRLGVPFNSVLANLCGDGRDSTGGTATTNPNSARGR